MTYAAVQAAYERWVAARTALTAGRRRDLPAPPFVAAQARAAYAAFWEAAGIYEREQVAAGHVKCIGFRMAYAGHWIEGADTGAVVDANPAHPDGGHVPRTKAERERRRLANRR